MNPRKGFFITFEGGEGSGKTTQINKLAEHLTDKGHKVVTTREPGGTPEAEKIRDLLVQRGGGDWTPMSECLMMFAARHIHVQKIILPALQNGKIVICDRFTDSTRAYQGYGHEFPLETIEAVNDLVLGGLKPNLTLILDIDVQKGLDRAEDRLSANKLQIERREDRFEKMDIEFHERLRQGFLEIAKREPERCSVLNAALAVEKLTKKIITLTEERLQAYGPLR